MKKKVILFMSMLLSIFVISACGDSETNEDTNNATVEAESLKVALVIPGTVGDLAVMDSAANGIALAEEELDIDGELYEAGWDSTNWEPTMWDVADSGEYDVIITGMFDMVDITTKVAAEYPDITFIQYDSQVEYEDGANSNVYSMDYKYNEGGFLAGYAAATLSETKTLGLLGAMSVPPVNDFMLGYKAGVDFYEQDVELLINYTNSFNDSTLGKELALLMYNNGADIIAQIAAVSGLGAIDAAEEVDKKVISTDSDMGMAFKESNPEKAETILFSVIKRIDQSIVRALELHINNELPVGTGETLGMSQGTVEITENEYYEKFVSADLHEELKELEEQILNGEIVIPSAYELPIEEVQEFLGV